MPTFEDDTVNIDSIFVETWRGSCNCLWERSQWSDADATLKLETETMDYFSTDVFEGEMAHARFYDKDIREQFPKCLYRRYTISEIINAIIDSGFTLKRFDEHPAWEDKTLPGEFTAIAIK